MTFHSAGGGGWGFTSAQQDLTSNSLLTIAHGLGVKPSSIRITMVCVSAIHGYSVGDVVEHSTITADSATAGRGLCVSSDATNVYLAFQTANPMVDKATFADRDSDNPHWKWVVEAKA